MRHLFKILLLSILWQSCDSETSVPETTTGVSFKLQMEENANFLHFNNLSEAEIQFTYFSGNVPEIESVTITAEYIFTSIDSLSERVEFFQFVPEDFDQAGFLPPMSVDTEEIMSKFGFESFAEISGGDEINFYNEVTMTNGNVYPDTVFNHLNIDPTAFYLNNTSTFSPGFKAYVACPSNPEEWVGEYETWTDYPCLIFCTFSRDVTITSNFLKRPFVYTTTSHDGGFWGSVYPGSLDVPGNFLDMCGNPILLPSPTGGQGKHVDTGGGYRDPDTGEFYYNWCNMLNPICATTYYTPIDD